MHEVTVKEPEGRLLIKEVEVTKLNLQPGDVLAVKVFADDINAHDLAGLRTQLQTLFKNNKIMLFALPSNGRIEMDVLDTKLPRSTEPASPCAEPMSYCNDCGCGKKERIEGQK